MFVYKKVMHKNQNDCATKVSKFVMDDTIAHIQELEDAKKIEMKVAQATIHEVVVDEVMEKFAHHKESQADVLKATLDDYHLPKEFNNTQLVVSIIQTPFVDARTSESPI